MLGAALAVLTQEHTVSWEFKVEGPSRVDKIGFCFVVLEIAILVSSTGYLIIIITLDHMWYGGCRMVGKGHHRTSLHTPCTDAHAQVLSVLFLLCCLSPLFSCIDLDVVFCRHGICVDGASARKVWCSRERMRRSRWWTCASSKPDSELADPQLTDVYAESPDERRERHDY